MAKHAWSVLCKHVVVGRDGNLTLVETFDRVTVNDDPDELEERARLKAAEGKRAALAVSFVVASRLSRSKLDEPEKAMVRLALYGPNRKRLLSQDREMDLEDYVNFQPRWNVEAVPYAGLGTYVFRVQMQSPSGRWKTVAELDLHLQGAEAPA